VCGFCAGRTVRDQRRADWNRLATEVAAAEQAVARITEAIPEGYPVLRANIEAGRALVTRLRAQRCPAVFWSLGASFASVLRGA
jgi:hypothetical protein